MVLALSGVVFRLAGAFVLTRTLSSLLFGITARDAITLIVISLLLVGGAFVASYLPARRAAEVDPVHALRGQAR